MKVNEDEGCLSCEFWEIHHDESPCKECVDETNNYKKEQGEN